MQLNQAIKQSKRIRVSVCDSDGRFTKFYISKKDAREAYHPDLFYGIDFLNSESDGTQFNFDEKYSGFLNIIIR